MDPVAYSAIPSSPRASAPPADSVITIRPEPLTIRLISHETEAVDNRRWGLYCGFIVLSFLFVSGAFYFIVFSTRKN